MNCVWSTECYSETVEYYTARHVQAVGARLFIRQDI